MPHGKREVGSAFARARAGDRRLAPWMTRNHDELLRELGTSRIAWTVPLKAFARLGLTDEHGQPLTRDTASRTWRRVRSAVAAERQAEVSSAPRPGELVRGVRLIAPARPPTAWSAPVPSQPSSPAFGGAPTVGGVDEATERIRAVLDTMGASRVPLPAQPSRLPPAADARPASDRIRKP